MLLVFFYSYPYSISIIVSKTYYLYIIKISPCYFDIFNLNFKHRGFFTEYFFLLKTNFGQSDCITDMTLALQKVNIFQSQNLTCFPVSTRTNPRAPSSIKFNHFNFYFWTFLGSFRYPSSICSCYLFLSTFILFYALLYAFEHMQK